MWSNLPFAINLAMTRVLCSRGTPWMTRAGSNKSSFFVPRSLERMKLTFRSSAASLEIKAFPFRQVGVRGGVHAQISIWIKRHAALRPASKFNQMNAPRIRNAHLDGKECLVSICWVSFEETREKLEISTWGIDAIELACMSWG